jgi:radical SAM protein with 4Fe4S-binding SPASM domain
MYCLAEAEYYGIIESGYNIRKCEQDIGMQISGGKYAENLNNLDCSSNYFNFKCKKCFLLPVCMGGCKRNQVCPIYFYTIDDRLRIYYGNIFNGTGNIG